MPELDVKMTLRAYDYLCPFLLGDAPTPGVRLAIDRHAPLALTFPDGVDVAEVSFNRYVGGYAKGDDSMVGLPAFVLRGFRHRNFFVLADSPLRSLADLKGKRLGTNSWPDTGTMWARVAMGDAGVGVEDVSWVLGTLDPKTPSKPPSPNDAQPPRTARYLTGSEDLMTELAEGRIDALTTAFAPEAVFRKGGAIRRLVENYPEVEADYHRRTGIYPGFHIVAVRRSFAEAHPRAVMAIYDGMRQSYAIWTEKVKKFSEASPWAMHELELMLRDFPEDTPPFGLTESNRRMVEMLCREQHAQGLVAKAADPAALFTAFEAVQRAAG